MTPCLFIENIFCNLSILTQGLDRETTVEAVLLKKKKSELTCFDVKSQEDSLNGQHQYHLAISSTLSHCGINYFLFIDYMEN